MKPTLQYSTPEAEGIASSAIENFVTQLGAIKHIHGFVLQRHGKVIAEGAAAPYTLDTPHELFSLSKSFTSSAVGIAQGEGLLCIDDRLVDIFPEYVSDRVGERMRRMTLRHLLTMSPGFDETAFAGPHAIFAQPDIARAFIETEPVRDPGTAYRYNSECPYMLSAAIQKVSGVTLTDYLRPRLFDPLGFGDVVWQSCRRGINLGGWGLWISTRELAAFTQLWLQRGAWQSLQIIPLDYVAMASGKQIDNTATPWTNPSPDWNMGYGFQFWQCRYNCFRGDGYAGQFALVMPEQDIALAITSGTNALQEILNIAFSTLIPAAKHKRLPAASEPLCLSLCLPICAESTCAVETLHATSPCEMSAHVAVSGTYVFDENPLGLEAVEFTPTTDAVALKMQYADRVPEFVAGFDAPAKSRTCFAYAQQRNYGAPPTDVFARAAWLSESVLEVTVLPMGTPSYFTLTFTFDGDALSLRHATPIWFCNESLLDVTVRGKRTNEDTK